MRALDCPCGEHLEARNDSQLLEAAKRHAQQDHEGDERFSETNVKTLVNTQAYDAA